MFKIVLTCFFACFILVFPFCDKNNDNNADKLREAAPPIVHEISNFVNADIHGYLEALPSHYQETTTRYPLIIFLHGSGQFGNGQSDLHLLLLEGIPELLNAGIFPPAFNVNGKVYSFVIVAPQFMDQPSTKQVIDFVYFARNYYRIDTSKVYLSGFSNGGILTCDVTADFPDIFAAIVPIAGASTSGDVRAKCKVLAEHKIPVWFFHNEEDKFVPISITRDFLELMKEFNPPIPPRLTVFPAYGSLGHDAWTRATDPQYKEEGKNIYEWMLQYSTKR